MTDNSRWLVQEAEIEPNATPPSLICKSITKELQKRYELKPRREKDGQLKEGKPETGAEPEDLVLTSPSDPPVALKYPFI